MSTAITKLVRVNSRYRSSGTTSDFTMSFNNHELDNCKTVAIVRASLPRMMGNIYPPINVITYQVNTSVFTITVPAGQYTITSLCAALSSASSGDFLFAYDAATDRVRVTFLPVGPPAGAYIYGTSTIGPYIGLMLQIQTLPGVVTPVDSPPSLSGPDDVYIESNLIANSNCCDVAELGDYIPFIGFIPYYNVPTGFTGSFIQPGETNNYLLNYRITQGQQTIRTFDMRLTDRFGNILVGLPDNAYLDLHLLFTYE